MSDEKQVQGMSKDRFSRRDFLNVAAGSAALGTLSGLGLGSAFGAESSERPNVLVIMADDLGYGDLSCYGAPDLQSPNIDRLVSRGMRFDRFYANCPVCSPTRAATLTGRYPDLVGVPGVVRTHDDNNWGHLSPNATLLPSLLQSAGYHTSLIGKWHLGLSSPNLPNERGFDHFHGWLGDMMDDYWAHRRHGINYMRRNKKTIDPEGHATELFTEWARDYIRDQAKTDQPFFMFLTYNAPHAPIQPPEDWLKRVKQREEGISDRRAKLVALIEHMDDGIGRVLRTLEKTGQKDNTLVIFTSDNGGKLHAGANNGPLHGGKGEMWEGGLRVPTCAVWPGHIEPGTRSDFVGMTMDLLPTVCDIAGADINHEIEGISLRRELMTGRQKDPNRNLFWVRREGHRYNGGVFYAARRGPWKLLQNHPSEEFKLFNLKEDPREQNPLGKDHPKYDEMMSILKAHRKKADKVPWRRPKK